MDIPEQTPRKQSLIRHLLRIFLIVWALAAALIAYRLAVLTITEGLGGLLNGIGQYLKFSMWTVSIMEIEPYLICIGLLFIVLNLGKTKLNRLVLFCVALGGGLWAFYRLFNLVHVYYTGGHIEKDILIHIDRYYLKLLLDIRMIPLLLLTILTSWMLVKLFRKFELKTFKPWQRIAVLILLAFTSQVMVGFIGYGRTVSHAKVAMSEFKNDNATAYNSPEMTLLSSFLGKIDPGRPFDVLKHAQAPSDAEAKALMTPQLRQKLSSKFGIEINPEASIPLRKEHVYREHLPYEPAGDFIGSPNVIVILFESLPARLIGYYGSPHKGITPNLDRFASASTVVRPAYNSSIPTAYGVISSFCSHFPVYDWTNWTDQQGNMVFDLLCLPEVLRPLGYHTYDAQPGNPYHADRFALMTQNGTDTVIAYNEIKKHLGHDPVAFPNKYSDNDMFRTLIDEFEGGKIQEPFLFTVSTLNFHAPYKLPADFDHFPEGQPDILKALFAVDDAFGVFWSWFIESQYAKNTIIVASSDHTMFPGSEYKEVTNGKSFGMFDEVPFIIYDPTHALPQKLNVTATSVDITPSVLHLLEIDIPNPFEGLSVFGQNGRPSHPGLLGTQDFHHFYLTDQSEHEFNSRSLECSEKQRKAKRGDRFKDCDFLDWYDYKRWMMRAGRIWSEQDNVHLPSQAARQ